ncbi:hypothetical protein F5B20DRAFT_585278 [Whalleya microplaca]|nr:hypothetical protein F5B20DRAFT_585278 [Whalleya microplaca]
MRRFTTRLVAARLPPQPPLTTACLPRPPVLLATGRRYALGHYDHSSSSALSSTSSHAIFPPHRLTTATMSSSASSAQPSSEPTPSSSAPPPPEPSTSPSAEPAQPAQPALPALTPAEFHGYNRLAEHMDLFHAHFRHTWNVLWGACVAQKRPARMSPRAFVSEGLGFLSQLETHHSIEETYIFPVLAKRMPEFRVGKGSGSAGNGGGAELLRQHREIHRGMEGMQEYLRRCRAGEVELELPVLKEKMESWGAVLWRHLDQEVQTLGAENMRKYWTIEEIRRIPM